MQEREVRIAARPGRVPEARIPRFAERPESVVRPAELPLPPPISASIAFKRGFVGVEASLAGNRYRFVNTHLEVETPDPANPL